LVLDSQERQERLKSVAPTSTTIKTRWTSSFNSVYFYNYLFLLVFFLHCFFPKYCYIFICIVLYCINQHSSSPSVRCRHYRNGFVLHWFRYENTCVITAVMRSQLLIWSKTGTQYWLTLYIMFEVRQFQLGLTDRMSDTAPC